MPAQVPGSVYATLLELGKMPDPYYRDNELKALELMENDFVYETTVQVDAAMFEADTMLLCVDGIDTLAEIYWNDMLLGHVDNMHRAWEFDVRGVARVGENTLRV